MINSQTANRAADLAQEARMRFEVLTFLRGFAALWIVGIHMYHSHNFHREQTTLISQSILLRPGSQMFFLISGYSIIAMAQSCLRRSESAPSFLRRRMLRIYLPFFAAVVVVILARIFIRLEASIGVAADSSLSVLPDLTWIEWLRTLTLAQIFVGNSSDISATFAKTNPVFWFVAIMVQFYLVVAIALASRRHFWWVIGGITLFALPFTLNRYTEGSGIFLPFWPSFVLGSLLYILFDHEITPGRLLGRMAGPACLVIFVSMMACVAYFMLTVFAEPYHGCLRLALALCFALLLWFARVLEEPIRRFSASNRLAIIFPMRVLAGLGAASFSIYLLHWPLLDALRPLVNAISPVDNLLVRGALCAVAMISLSYLFYRYCEQPLQKAKSSRWTAPDMVPLPSRSAAMATPSNGVNSSAVSPPRTR